MGTKKCSLPSSKLTIYLILLTNIMLLMSLILAICWIRVIYELCNGPCSPWMSLWLSGRASEHGKIQRSEATGTQIRQKTPFSISLPNSKTYHLSYSIKSYLGKTVTKSD